MAAVLPVHTSEFGLFRTEFGAHFAAEPAYSVSLLGRYSPASFAMYEAPYHSGSDLNRTSQPCSPSVREFRRPISQVNSSSSPGSASTTLLGRSTSPLVSARGMIVVLDFTPSEGEADTPVTVNLQLRSNPGDDKEDLGQKMSLTSLKLRLVFGRTAVKTTVRRLPPSLLAMKDHRDQKSPLHLQLRASAPSYSEARFPEQFCVPLTIQAMDGSTKVVESFTFGSFSYWAPSKSPPFSPKFRSDLSAATIRPTAMVDIPQLPSVASPSRNKRKRLEDDAGQYSPPSGSSGSPPISRSPKKAHALPPRPEKIYKLVRTTNLTMEELNGAEAQPAILEWVVDNGMPHPNSLDKNW